MYTQQDFIDTRKETKKRTALMILLMLLFLAAVIACTALRLQYLQMAASGLGFAVCYFLWNFKLTPWLNYNKFMKDMQNGQKRKTECEFVYFTPETRLFDGVEVHEITVTVGKTEKDERMFVLDADKKLPEINKGDKITITSFGNFILDIEKAA